MNEIRRGGLDAAGARGPADRPWAVGDGGPRDPAVEKVVQGVAVGLHRPARLGGLARRAEVRRADGDIDVGEQFGGDGLPAAAVQDAGVADKIGFISTGGGATIELLEGRTLPGVEALRDREVARR